MQEAQARKVNAEEITEAILAGMLDKKAMNVVVMDLREIKHAVSDFFIICSGSSDTQIDAIADAVEEEVKKRTGQTPWKREGRQNKEWVLIDYVDVVVHVFHPAKRQFFGLEELWGDAQVERIEASN